ncbi:Mus7/MMS22 family-domain-containing protein [Lentinula raphanica]|nr:Mus7/MMS22 family-domain-containing protein [Lentinula raphanica]
MKDEYVETSDQDELEESRGLFYQVGARNNEPELFRKAKRRKTSHVFEADGEERGRVLSSSSPISKGPSLKRAVSVGLNSESEALHLPSQSLSPDTDLTEPLSTLFERDTDERAETPLSFPPSEDEDPAGQKDNEHGDVGVEDVWEMSQDLLDLIGHEEQTSLSPLPPSSIPQTSSSSVHPTEENVDGPLDSHQSPTTLPVSLHSPSPVPPPASIHDPSPSLHSLFSPRSVSPPVPNTEGDAELARSFHEGDSAMPKRNLRKRGEHQRRPYTFDKLMYMQQMKNAPEALVTPRHLEKERRSEHERRRRDGYVSEDESQEQEYQPASDLEDESQIPQDRVRHSEFDANPAAGDELLPSLSESSDEEMRDLRKEARRNEKERRRKEKDAKRAEKARLRDEKAATAEKEKVIRMKSFPVREKAQRTDKEDTNHVEDPRNPTSGPSHLRPTHAPSSTPEPEPEPSRLHRRSFMEADEGDFSNIGTPNSAPHGDNQPASSFKASDWRFDNDDTVGSGPDSASHFPPSRSSSPIFLPSRSTPEKSADSDLSSDPDSGSGSHFNAKEKRQLKTLGRMYPSFMLPALGVKTGTHVLNQEKERTRRQASTVASTDDDENHDGLRPGIAKVRVRKGNSKPVKGDSESEEEKGTPIELAPSLSPSFTLSGSNRRQHSQTLRIDVPRQEIIEISSSSSEDSAGDETNVDDEEIADFFDRSDNADGSTFMPSRTTVRDELLIDYMLARNVCIGGPSKRKGGKPRQQSRSNRPTSHMNVTRPRISSSSASKSSNLSGPGGYRYDFVRAGQTGGRQSLLSFENHRRVRESHEIRAPDYDQHDGSGDSGDEDDQSEEDVGVSRMRSGEEKSRKKDTKKLTWKQKAKQRREAQRMHGVYTHVADPGTRLMANPGDGGVSESTGNHTTNSKNRSTTKRKVKKVKKAKRKGIWKDFNFTADDERINAALAPPVSQQRLSQTTSDSTSSQAHCRSANNVEPHIRKQSQPSNAITVDTDFALLNPGSTFGLSTFIKRGLLYELLQLIHAPSAQTDNSPIHAPASRPSHYASYKIPTLNLVVSLSKPPSDFIKDFPSLCQMLGDFITGLPDVDEDVLAQEWKAFMRGVEEVLTGLMKIEEADVKVKLRDTISATINSLLVQMRAADLNSSTIDLMTLDVCWFAVEMLLRAGFTVPSASPLSDACRLLVQYLLEVDPGIRDAMRLMRDSHRGLNDMTSVVQREAELWVCLIHVLRPVVPGGAIFEHPLWEYVREELVRRSSTAPKWSLQANETIWQTIAGLCALSQFSEHGLCKNKSSLPQSWKTVMLGLKSVQLKVDPDADHQLNSDSTRIKDRYFAFVVRRCFLLVSRWNWAVESSFPVLNTISSAFSTRKFCDLLHEKPEFPEFLRTQRWDSCFEYTRRDSAFVLFLKLVIQRGISLKRSNKPSVHAMEKNLTLITPLGSVMAFSKADPPQGNELSMLYNRMAATAVRLHLSPSDFHSRVHQARQYFNFQTLDDTSRLACIRSLMYVTQLMILDNLPLGETEVKAWYLEIIEALTKEYKEVAGKETVVLNRVRFLLNAVLGSLRHILNAYNDPGVDVQYPDSSFLDVALKIGRESSVIDNVQTGRTLVAVIRTFLSLRDKVIAPPELPPLAPLTEDENGGQDSQDSQDYGDVDIDMDDPAIVALLGGTAISEEGTKSDSEAKDRALGKASVFQTKLQIDSLIMSAQSLGPLTWLLYRCLKNMIQDHLKGRAPSSQYMNNIDGWIDTWVQCASIAITHSQSMTWFSLCLDVRNTWKGISDAYWRRRIDIRVALNILQRTPKSYLDDKLKEYFFEILFQTLIPGEVTVEHEFLSWLISIDGLRHPLMRSLPVTLPPRPEILLISKDEFALLRDKLFKGFSFLDNIEQSLHEEENHTGDRIGLGDNAVNQKYGDYLSKFFSSLKEMYLSTPEGSKEREAYKLKCKEVGTMAFDKHARIGTWRRLAIWDAWWRGLN